MEEKQKAFQLAGIPDYSKAAKPHSGGRQTSFPSLARDEEGYLSENAAIDAAVNKGKENVMKSYQTGYARAKQAGLDPSAAHQRGLRGAKQYTQAIKGYNDPGIMAKDEGEFITKKNQLEAPSPSGVKPNANINRKKYFEALELAGIAPAKEYNAYFDGKFVGTVKASSEEEAQEKMMEQYPEYNYGLYDGVAEVEENE